MESASTFIHLSLPSTIPYAYSTSFMAAQLHHHCSFSYASSGVSTAYKEIWAATTSTRKPQKLKNDDEKPGNREGIGPHPWSYAVRRPRWIARKADRYWKISISMIHSHRRLHSLSTPPSQPSTTQLYTQYAFIIHVDLLVSHAARHAIMKPLVPNHTLVASGRQRPFAETLTQLSSMHSRFELCFTHLYPMCNHNP